MPGYRRQGPPIPLKQPDLRADVLVVGAGPAGVALAMRLKRLGYGVVLAAVPANAAHGLEMLNPAAQEQLAFEGLSAGHGVAAEFEIRWRPGDFERRAQASMSLLVDRSAFHAGLRHSAAQAGIRTLDGRAEAPEERADGWRLRIGAHEASARLLVDATGRRGMAPAVRQRGPPLIGLHTSWTGERLPSAVRVAAAPDGWVWGAPKPGGGYTTSVFQDGRLAKVGSRIAWIRRIVAESGILEGAAHADLAGDVAASNATQHVAFAQDRLSLFRIGDAALALDPISSSGIQAALQSAVDATLAIHTLSEDPEAGAMVESFVERRLERRAARHATWTAAFYGEPAKVFATPFWTARASAAAPSPEPPSPPLPDQPVTLGPGVRLQEEPCPVGDRIAMRQVVAPPGAAEPIAIVDGVEIAPLFAFILPRATVMSLLLEWSARIGEDHAFRLFGWAWRAGLLGP
jgi:flavin-dependent dehydrogenase